MKVLVDTHALLWFLRDDAALSPAARAAVETADEAWVSVVSLWEIAIKTSLGKLTLNADYRTFFDEHLAKNDFSIAPVRLEHLARVVDLPFHHRDPFDRMLAAYALVEDVPLVSRDRAFDAYGVTRLW